MTQQINESGLDAAEFMADIGALAGVQDQGVYQNPIENVNGSNIADPAVNVPENTIDIDNKIEADIQNDIALEKELDDILNMIDTEKTSPNSEEVEIVNDNPIKKDNIDISDKLSLEQQEELVTVMEELEQKYEALSREKASLEAEKEQILYENQKYKERTRNYIDKVQSLENDETRFQVSDEYKNLIYFSNELKKTDNPVQKKILEDKIRRESTKITEALYGKSLDSYVSDYYTLGWDNLNGSESFWQYDVNSMLQQRKQQQDQTKSNSIDTDNWL